MECDIMKLVYPACFYPEEDDYYTVVFPDLQGAVTEGKTLLGAVEMAEDCACGWILSTIEDGESIPKPTPISNVKANEYENGIVTLIVLDIDSYAEKHGDKAVRKNCTIPNWLNTIAERENVNFSAVLQEALKQKLNI